MDHVAESPRGGHHDVIKHQRRKESAKVNKGILLKG
jgi:hypothetical protein